MDPKKSGARSGARAIVAGVALAVLAAGCTRPGPDVYGADCKTRDVRRADAADSSLSEAVARQAELNRTYRDCLERRAVRVAR